MQTVVPHGILLPPEKIRLPDQLSREKELRDELSNLAVLGKYIPFLALEKKIFYLDFKNFIFIFFILDYPLIE